MFRTHQGDVLFVCPNFRVMGDNETTVGLLEAARSLAFLSEKNTMDWKTSFALSFLQSVTL